MNHLNYPTGLAGAASIAALLVAGCGDTGPDPTNPSAPEPLGPAEAHSGVQQCVVADRDTEEVIPGVILTFTSSFSCQNAPDAGHYRIRVAVTNLSRSDEAVRIHDVRFRHTTPRPRGQAPQATARASGLPVTISPGKTESFTVTGEYELVRTDEGKKANLHLTAFGEGVRSGRDFGIGINVQIRGRGAVEGDRTARDGPPGRQGRGGRPDDVPRGGPPSEVPRGRG